MDEHTALVDQADHVRRALGSGNPVAAKDLLADLVRRLDRHVHREEDGIFRALRTAGELLEEIGALEGEHRALEATITGLDVAAPDFDSRVTGLLDDLSEHIDREDYGIFPVSVVTLGAAGWAIVDEAHASSPSFLFDPERESKEAPCRRSH
jgi:hemerythrin-like domain-containing protein